MIRHILLTVLAAMMALSLSAQNFEQIESEDISRGNAIFPTAGEWASVVIQTKESQPLRFSSNVDTQIATLNNVEESKIPKKLSAILYGVTKEGSNLIYKIRFRTDKKYAARVLTVTSTVFHTMTDISLQGLEKKREYRYRIFSSVNTEDITCYKEHTLKGDQHYMNFKYPAAREEYKLASQCAEATPAEKKDAEQNIQDCDSILYYIEEGNSLAQAGRYEQAAMVFLRAYNLNTNDDYLASRYEYCSRKMRNLCSFYVAEAERSYREKDYETALTLYKEVLDNSCATAIPVSKRYEDCIVKMRRSSNYERYFGIEGGKNMWGFTVGNYRSKTGAFFTMRSNGATFGLMRREYEIGKTPNLDLSIGVTIPLLPERIIKKIGGDIFKGVWLNVGVGGTGMVNYQVRKSVLGSEAWTNIMGGKTDDIVQSDIDTFIEGCAASDKYSDEYTEIPDVLMPKFRGAVGGELGLTVKVWHVAVRGTYNLRYPISKAKQEFPDHEKGCFTFGLGWCW